VGILRPAALSYLEIESMLEKQTTAETPFPTLDRTDIETDFNLNQKSYALTINAVSMLATNRPTFFGDSASCLARRAIDLPTMESSTLSKAATMAVKSHLRASCLTLLRNALSVTSGASDILHKALSSDICGMKIQADKALRMATQAADLIKGGRAARNRAAVFYQWEGDAAAAGGAANDMGALSLGSKRKRAGENKLEKMRAAKSARGLGNGIQLPKNMPDACDLILLNLGNIPSSRAAATVGDKKSKVQHEKRSRPFTLDYFVDAIMTNGDSLASDENRWYGRDGGDAWVMDISALVSEDEAEDDEDEAMDGQKSEKKKSSVPVTFTLDMKTANAASAAKKGETNDDVTLFQEQCQVAAADAFERILKRSRNVRDQSVADFGNQIAAKMAWSLKSVKPLRGLKEAGEVASAGIATIARINGEKDATDETTVEHVKSFAKNFPLVSSCIQFDIETNAQANDTLTNESSVLKPSSSLTQRILNEAFLLQDESNPSSKSEKDDNLYENTLDLYIATVLQACEKADEKPMDNNRKKIASTAASSLSKELSQLPSINEHSLELASQLCDIDGITKKAIEASRKASNKTVATAAAANGTSCIQKENQCLY
jgi:symplekin